jgi:hypothetical protein
MLEVERDGEERFFEGFFGGSGMIEGRMKDDR